MPPFLTERDTADHEHGGGRDDGQVAPRGRFVDRLGERRGQAAVRSHQSAVAQAVDLLVTGGKSKPGLHPAETRIKRSLIGGAGLDGTKIDPSDLLGGRLHARGGDRRTGHVTDPLGNLIRDRRRRGHTARDREAGQNPDMKG